MRVKANTLKTAMAVAIALQRSPRKQADLALVNQVRAKWLQLSPVKAISAADGIQHVLSLLSC